MLVKVSRLAQQVKGNIGNGNVLFQHRSVAGPFAAALGKNQGVVGKMKGVEEKLIG